MQLYSPPSVYLLVPSPPRRGLQVPCSWNTELLLRAPLYRHSIGRAHCPALSESRISAGVSCPCPRLGSIELYLADPDRTHRAAEIMNLVTCAIVAYSVMCRASMGKSPR